MRMTMHGMLPLLLLAIPAASQSQSRRLLPDEQNTVDVFQRVSPSVVYIKASLVNESKLETEVKEGGTGTGFVIDREGHILTNFHVVENMNQVEVVLNNGRRLSAQLVGTAPYVDVALLQIQPVPDEVVPLSLGDSSSLRIGQKVIAIGNPLGLQNTITVGVVSALHRSVGETPIELQDSLIQTDAAINPGSSGGPLLNSAGEVVGINTAFVKNAQQVGFAVPINFVRQIIPDLTEMGHPYRPQLGFSTDEITPNLARLFGLPLERGLLIEEVLPGSPAASVGLRAGSRVVLVAEKPYVLGGDIIIAANDKELTSSSDLAHVLLEARPGQVVRLKIYRNGQEREVHIPLQEMHMNF